MIRWFVWDLFFIFQVFSILYTSYKFRHVFTHHNKCFSIFRQQLFCISRKRSSRFRSPFRFLWNNGSRLEPVYHFVFPKKGPGQLIVCRIGDLCLNVSTTPLQQWGFGQCLPFSWTTLRGKHCWHPIAIIRV